MTAKMKRREFITLLGGAAIFVYLLSRTFFPMAVRTYSSC
jgi:signal peptidase I